MDFVGNAKKCTQIGYIAAAEEIGCEESVLRAVIAVETGGRGFDGNMRPVALFEPHVFYRLLRNEKRRDAVNSGLAYPKWGSRPYPRDSYPRIVAACRIDAESAQQATSWGLSQILGINYKAAGYDSAGAMVTAFKDDEDVHLMAMARFIVASSLDVALKHRDWKAFAHGYNGPRYAANAYDEKLAQAYMHFKVDRPMAVMITPLPRTGAVSNAPSIEAAPRLASSLLSRLETIFRR